MSAGYAVGIGPVPDAELAVRVGGPLSTLRAEAAGLLQLFSLLSENQQAQLLVFIDSLVLLDTLQKWGKANFNPRPCIIIHFDVIFPLLRVLRQWQFSVLLVKVKSHTGCLLNERADGLAERGYDENAHEVCSAPEVWIPLAEGPTACSYLGCPEPETTPKRQCPEPESSLKK
jgi:ribonuclease HI